jgi:hypothetical protein
MAVALGDVFNRGHLDAFVTNISEKGYLFQNNNLRVNELNDPTQRRFHNVADPVVADAGWAWGAQFGDLNNDGTNELFVVNGFISDDPKIELLVLDVEDRRRQRAAVRGRQDVARLRSRELIGVRAFARVRQSRSCRLGRRREVRRSDRSL